MVELLPLSQLQSGIGQGENACRRTPADASKEAAQGQRPWSRLGAFPSAEALYGLWAIQSSDNGGLKNSACLGVKNIGIGVGRDADEGGNSQNRMHGLMREGR